MVTITSDKTCTDRTSDRLKVALTIAGLDPSGGAGLIADVRTFDALGVFGMAVASSITYQSTQGTRGRHDLSVDVISAQLKELMADSRPDAIKTGVLGNAETIREVTSLLDEYSFGPLVVDPVLTSGKGAALMEEGGLQALIGSLIPRATLVTPNIEEGKAISGLEIFDVSDMKTAALYIRRLGPGAVLMTGGTIEEEGRKVAADVLVHDDRVEVFTDPWLEGAEVHGTGCVLSAAITASLALGMDLRAAVINGRKVVREAMKNAVKPGRGAPCANPPSVRELWTED